MTDKPKSKSQILMLGLATTVCFSLNLGFRRASGIFFFYFQDAFGASAAEASMVYSLQYSMTYLGEPFYNAFFKSFGTKVSLMTSSLMLSIGYIGVFWANTVSVLVLFFGVFVGIGSGLGHLSSFTIMGKTFNKKRNFANNIITSFSMAVAMLSAPFCQCLMQFYTWKDVFLLQGALLLNCIPFGWIASRNFILLSNDDVEEQIELNKQIGCDEIQPTSLQQKTNRVRIVYNSVASIFDISLLKDPWFWLFCLSCIGLLGWRHVLAQYFVRFAIDSGLDKQSAATLLAIRLAAALVFMLVVGFYTSDFKEVTENKRNLSCKLPHTSVIVIVTSVLLSLVYFIPIICEAHTGYLVFAFICGVADGCIGVLPISLIPVYFGEDRISGALGFRSLTTGIFDLALPPMVGRWIDVTRNFKPSLYICAILNFSGALFLLVLHLSLGGKRNKSIKSEKESNRHA